jgi:hypothetical protein
MMLTMMPTTSEVQEHRIYTRLLALSPTLEERLCTGSEQELFHIADMVRAIPDPSSHLLIDNS